LIVENQGGKTKKKGEKKKGEGCGMTKIYIASQLAYYPEKWKCVGASKLFPVHGMK
jgi:hypothetical protein